MTGTTAITASGAVLTGDPGTEQGAHTPAPWAIRRRLPDDAPMIVCADGAHPLDINKRFSSAVEANAHFIVRAVNAHDDLVRAMVDLRRDTKKLARELQQGNSKRNAADVLLAMSANIDAVLTKAGAAS